MDEYQRHEVLDRLGLALDFLERHCLVDGLADQDQEVAEAVEAARDAVGHAYQVAGRAFN
jgi:N-acetylmuramic acid 6-phosphate (MurNAc-6-P) etherase